MAYFEQTLMDISHNIGFYLGTELHNTISSIERKDAFEAFNQLLDIRGKIPSMVNNLSSISELFKRIDTEENTENYKKVETIIDCFNSKKVSRITSLPIGLINIFDISINHIRNKEFSSALTIIENWKKENGKINEELFELLNIVTELDKKQLSEDTLELINTGKLMYKGKIFISYSFKNDSKIVNEVVTPLLEKLNLKVFYAPRDFPASESPGKNAKEFIKKSGLLIAFIPVDITLAGNVIHEIGLAGDKKVAIFAEIGSSVPSNLRTTGTYTTFSRRNISKLMLDIIDVIKKEKFL